MVSKKLIQTIFKVLKWILTITVLIVLVAVIVQRVSNNKVSFFGYGIYTIISESMLPDYEIGDMFIAKNISEDDIRVGDDLVYIGKEDSYLDKVITHRVVRIDNMIHTKGINNPMEDPAISYDQVYGKVVTKLFLLSMFSKLMNNSILFYLIIFIPFGLLVFFDIKGIVKDKRSLETRKREEYENKLEEQENNLNNNIVNNVIVEQNYVSENTIDNSQNKTDVEILQQNEGDIIEEEKE